MTRVVLQSLCSFSAAIAISSGAQAFPPYRSTDADTADPWVLETRLGLVKASRDGHETELAAPLMRVNLGLPQHLELVSEAEYVPRLGRLGDAAAGAKWIPLPAKLAFGTEVLVLLPVSDAGGVGIEAQALASYHPAPLRLHANAGGFADGRVDPSERGWRASALAELELGAARPGLELFGKQVSGEDVQLMSGVGSIVDLGWFRIRLGIHAGLTEAAPDLVASLWLSKEFALAGDE